MLDFELDVVELSREFFLTKPETEELVSTIISNLTNKTKDRWELIASKGLHKTKDEYIRSLIIGDEGLYIGFVKLQNQLPNMIEQGANPFDMKTGFSHAKNIKVKKDGGWYMTVPFRWASSSSLGENSYFSAKMPEDINKIVKKKAVNSPLTLSEIPEHYKNLGKGVRKEIKGLNPLSNIPEYKHKNFIYEGITKKQKTEKGLKGGAKHTQYMSFRRVSDLSDVDSWIHAGFVAKNFAQQALDSLDIENEVDKLIDDYLVSIGKK